MDTHILFLLVRNLIYLVVTIPTIIPFRLHETSTVTTRTSVLRLQHPHRLQNEKRPHIRTCLMGKDI